MMPSFKDVFSSCFKAKTYAPGIEVSDQSLQRYVASNDQPEVRAVQELFREREAQEAFSAPLGLNETPTLSRNAVLERRGFKLLSQKVMGDTKKLVPYHSVVEHASLPGWIIKSGAEKTDGTFVALTPPNSQSEYGVSSRYDSLLRIPMAERIEQVVQRRKFELFYTPKKKLVAYQNPTGTSPDKKYCVLVKKQDVFSSEETVRRIALLNAVAQKALAKEICTIIREAGVVDASFDNIRLVKEGEGKGKLAFIDTEPWGLIDDKGQKGSTLEKCARMGLYSLYSTTNALRGSSNVTCFQQQVAEEIYKEGRSKLSTKKIVLSVVSLGILPLIYAIFAKIHLGKIKKLYQELQKGPTVSLTQKYFKAVENIPVGQPSIF